MEIRNNTFVVTGGASGLGAASVEMIVAGGGNAIIADLSKEAGEALASKLGKQSQFVACDVTREDHAKAAIEAATQQFGGIHGLVNCAGIAIGEKTVGRDGPHRLESFTKVININLIGSFNMIRLAADAMAKQEPNAEGERGVIINTASVAAFDGQIGQAAYSASKGGIVGMTLPIARDLSRPVFSRPPCSKACLPTCRSRWASRYRFHRASDGPLNSRSWCSRYSRMSCSTAK
jgi:NAD(P)-dependent dehydrogenase (short-subunit alcohol dehydrogenase family)